MKVEEFVNQWLDSQRGNIQASTHHSDTVASGRLRSGLGHLQVQSLTPQRIELFYADLLDHDGRNGKPLSGNTVRNIERSAARLGGGLGVVGSAHRTIMRAAMQRGTAHGQQRGVSWFSP